MNHSRPAIINPYSPPEVVENQSSVVTNRRQKVCAYVSFGIGSIIGLNIGSAISEGLLSTFHKSADDISNAVWSFFSWAMCCFVFTCPWRFCRRVFLDRSRQASPLASFFAAAFVASLFYLTAQRIGHMAVLDIFPRWSHSSVFAFLALMFASACVEVEVTLTQLFSRADESRQ